MKILTYLCLFVKYISYIHLIEKTYNSKLKKDPDSAGPFYFLLFKNKRAKRRKAVKRIGKYLCVGNDIENIVYIKSAAEF